MAAKNKNITGAKKYLHVFNLFDKILFFLSPGPSLVRQDMILLYLFIWIIKYRDMVFKVLDLLTEAIHVMLHALVVFVLAPAIPLAGGFYIDY